MDEVPERTKRYFQNVHIWSAHFSFFWCIWDWIAAYVPMCNKTSLASRVGEESTGFRGGLGSVQIFQRSMELSVERTTDDYHWRSKETSIGFYFYQFFHRMQMGLIFKSHIYHEHNSWIQLRVSPANNVIALSFSVFWHVDIHFVFIGIFRWVNPFHIDSPW